MDVDKEKKEAGIERRGKEVKRIKKCCVHIATHHGDFNYYVLQVCANKNRNLKKPLGYPGVGVLPLPCCWYLGHFEAPWRGTAPWLHTGQHTPPLEGSEFSMF